MVAERIERLQQRRVRAAVEHAYSHLPFYRRVMCDQRLTPRDFRCARDLEKFR